MGEKGRGYGGGMITTPVKALWQAKEKIVLGSDPPALGPLQGQRRTLPKDSQEFMDKIIKENNIQLPTLPAGHTTFTTPTRRS